MTNTFEVHTIDSAPAESKATLQQTKAAFGAVPNLFGVFAESPAALQAYARLGGILEKQSAFSPTELQVVLLSTSYENDCTYCVAAHTAVAGAQKVPHDVIAAVRDGAPLKDPKLEALRAFTRAVVADRGWVSETALRAFLDAGYQNRHVLEVIVAVAFKTISNYTNHVADTPLDAAFQRFAWSKPAAVTG